MNLITKELWNIVLSGYPELEKPYVLDVWLMRSSILQDRVDELREMLFNNAHPHLRFKEISATTIFSETTFR